MEERKVVDFKKDEFAIREYIKKAVGKGKVSRVKIEYTPMGEKILVSTLLDEDIKLLPRQYLARL